MKRGVSKGWFFLAKITQGTGYEWRIEELARFKIFDPISGYETINDPIHRRRLIVAGMGIQFHDLTSRSWRAPWSLTRPAWTVETLC
ncbi:MAG: hypothetical protein HQL79_02295 [Magnetococcales bacterium]|nr:hypothetical protein [Magnetococcales bacterium]